MTLAPFLMFLGVVLLVRRLSRDEKGFDLIDSHFLYPDGIASLLLGKVLRKPVTITCRGSDVNLHMKYRLPRQITRHLLPLASHVITVCQALKDELIRLKLNTTPITVLRNGVDTSLFHPVNQLQARKELCVSGEVWLSVGRLVELKGNHLTIKALSKRPHATLLLVGEGPDKIKLKKLAKTLDIENRIVFVGAKSQNELKTYYSAADILILASSREGWANVILEAMACGAKVVGSNVGGIPEVIGDSNAGRIFNKRNPEDIVLAVDQLLDNPTSREDVIRYAEKFSWKDTSIGQYNIFLQSD
jgi:glycosyltransferase involved in cell wall biosynthesis